jgi:uncharacterized protein (TIGR03435 family)
MADFARGPGSDLNTSNGLPMGVSMPRVTDKTGLSGIYEFHLEFEATMVMPGVPPPIVDTLDPGAGGPNLFTALEKQLGLKLVKTKNVPVDMLFLSIAWTRFPRRIDLHLYRVSLTGPHLYYRGAARIPHYTLTRRLR